MVYINHILAPFLTYQKSPVDSSHFELKSRKWYRCGQLHSVRLIKSLGNFRMDLSYYIQLKFSFEIVTGTQT
jgi:hypothetical protein